MKVECRSFRHSTFAWRQRMGIEIRLIGPALAGGREGFAIGAVGSVKGRWELPARRERAPGQARNGWTREAVLNGLRRLASELGRSPRTSDLMKARPYCPTIGTVVRLWGSLTDALREAGLPADAVKWKPSRWTAEKCVRALQRAAMLLGKIPTREDIDRLRKAGHNLPSSSLLAQRFGSFTAALAAAGLAEEAGHGARGALGKAVLSRLPGIQEAVDALRKDPSVAGAMRSVMGGRAFEAFAVYAELGRLEKAAAVLGVSKQRVHQLVARAVERWTAAGRVPDDAQVLRSRIDSAWNVSLVKLERVIRGLTQKKLAQATGVPVPTIRRMEKGRAVRRNAAEAVAAFFGRTVDELFESRTEQERLLSSG